MILSVAMTEGLPPQLSESVDRAVKASDCPEWVRVLLTLLTSFMESLFIELREGRRALERAQEASAELQAEVERLRKAPYNARSERGTGPGTAKSAPRPATPTKVAVQRAPRTGPHALDEAALEEEVVEHSIPPEALRCHACGGRTFEALPAEVSNEYELVVETLKRIIHRREKRACRCGGHIVTAPGPARVTEGGRYGAGLHAWLLTRRCMDAVPINRLGDILRRGGAPIATSTLNGLFHTGADKLTPLYALLRERIKYAPVVHADETPQRVLAPGKCETGFLWVFSSHEDVVMVHSEDRSGETPRNVLGDSTGFLIADGYTGYNIISETTARKRQGCMAHARRKFFEALQDDPERTRWMIGHIALLYAVESQVVANRLQGSAEHGRIRTTVCRAITDNMRAWLTHEKPLVRPTSRIGKAIAYMDRQWPRLTLFLDHPELPIDNNQAERDLRRPVLGRKTSLFVAKHESGQRYAMAFSLVMTCRKIGVDPITYLTWLLPQIDGHPASRVAELLPHAYRAEQLDIDVTCEL